MTKKLTDLESQAQQNSAKIKWVGDPLNDSDVGYDSEWYYVATENVEEPLKPKKKD